MDPFSLELPPMRLASLFQVGVPVGVMLFILGVLLLVLAWTNRRGSRE